MPGKRKPTKPRSVLNRNAAKRPKTKSGATKLDPFLKGARSKRYFGGK